MEEKLGIIEEYSDEIEKLTCSVENCSSKVKARGYCGKHYARFRRHGTVKLEKRTCSVEDCNLKHFGKGYCRKHHSRYIRLGTTELKKNRKG